MTHGFFGPWAAGLGVLQPENVDLVSLYIFSGAVVPRYHLEPVLSG
jgi:hypothetical protein